MGFHSAVFGLGDSTCHRFHFVLAVFTVCSGVRLDFYKFSTIYYPVGEVISPKMGIYCN